METSAVISNCGLYRYALTREWEPRLPGCIWVMLNPSTADATQDDPTIKRCIGFAKEWSAGSITVVNLFAYRTKSPAILKAAAKSGVNVVGPHNLLHTSEVISNTGLVVCGWGNDGLFQDQYRAFYDQAQALNVPLRCLKFTSKGQPWHPLYVKAGTPLQEWKAPSK